MPTPPNIDRLKLAHEAATLRFDTARLLAGEKKIKALYDGAESSKKRRALPIERRDDDGILTSTKRLTGVAQTRDIERNYSNAKGMLRQFQVNVVGSLGKLQLNIPGGEVYHDWFNQVWSKECDARDDNHWSDVLQCLVTAVIREGDIALAVDDGWMEGDGKLWTWESDQLCNLNDTEFKKRYPGATQTNGVVRDKYGRVHGYFVSGQRGVVSANPDECTFFKREDMRLIKRPWRVNQGRGIADLLTPVNDMLDLYDARARELQTMRVAASLAGFKTRADATMDFDNPLAGQNFLPENAHKSGAEIANEQAAGGIEPRNYERFEALTGGMFEYLDDGDKVEFPKIDRPNPNMQEFHDFVLSGAGASLGLARAYSRMRADSSYTSFRGDMIMSWATFYCLQKWLERRVCDWVAVKVINNAARLKEFPALPEGWERQMSWQWPTMPEVDEGAFEQAQAQKMRNGRGTLSDSVGPTWLAKIEQLGREKQAAEQQGIILPTMQTVAGATVAAQPGGEDNA